jgi:DNA-binding response OmpR family regulator
MVEIVLVEDERDMVDLLSTHLSAEGYQIRSANSLASAVSAVAQREPDLVLLDITLGNDDGRDVLREIRLLSDVPIIFLTGRGLESDRVAGLKMGADDDIVKPFSLGELSARIESVLRRGQSVPRITERSVLTFEDLSINESTREVRVRGDVIDLTAKEYSLLVFLEHSPRQVFSREQLLEHVWSSSGEWQNETTVTEHIRRLRHKIEVDRDAPKRIATARGLGYRFEPVVS